MNSHLKTFLVWALVIVGLLVGWEIFNNVNEKTTAMEQSAFYNFVEKNVIKEVKITGDEVGYQIVGSFKSKQLLPNQHTTTKFSTYVVKDESLIKELTARGVAVESVKPRDNSMITMLFFMSPIIIFLVVWFFFMRQMQSGGNRALSFGKSKAKLTSSQGRKVTFKDVAGVEEAKQELTEIIEFLREPQKFQKLGGKIPKGVLLMGPPGTGKTLLARAIAGEANVPFFSISGSDFVEMFVGVGASRVRDLFEQGKKNAPCIIFIDEIDAVGRHRGAGLGGGHDEREQTLNQLLVEMDGFETNDGVILIAATNRPDVLDPALLRPGRFDRQVVVGRPDVRGREEIIKVHTRKIPLAPDVDMSIIARATPGFSGADLANLVNEAALYAARRNRKAVEQEDFEIAKDKVLMGTERKSLIINDDEKRATAYHEAGHALVAYMLPQSDPLHKVTIIPRGRALGVTMQLPEDDRHTYSREYLRATLAVLMGGRVAEEIKLNLYTTGAGNDFERATEMARKMVTEWGMSDEMGPMTYGKQDEQVFLGREISQNRDYSEATAVRIDAEVRRFIQESYDRTKSILEEHEDALERIAQGLLEREVLDSNQIDLLVKGEPLPVKAEPEGGVETASNVPSDDAAADNNSADKKATDKGPGVLPEPGNSPA